ncbi:MAG: TIR domain-containing protein [Candidatus Cybelea sp.]
MEPQVFICHSSADAGSARAICARLEASGIGCWIAPRDPMPGVPYARQIVNAIGAARVVLLVFSANANASRQVLSELELASNRGKPIMPVRIEDVQPSSNLEFYVRATHWFDGVSRPFEEILPQLVRDVRMLLTSSEYVATAPSNGELAVRKASNLPLQLTSFVGRDRDVAQVEGLLHENRLVTLVGSGGAGKTRAAVEAGAGMLDGYRDGARFVEFAPISDGALVAPTIARVLGVRESPDSPLLDTLVAHLQTRNLLLILDNCEHVIDEVRSVAAAILRGSRGVRILATSRESLNIAGERVFRLPSLDVPPAGETMTAASAERYGAVALFADRALAANVRFELSDESAPFVAEICRRLDGIPLAIELAAARTTVLSPQRLAERLDERFRVLTGGDRSALPRHQTMRALIDWSYDLLSDEERALFRRASIFASGFTLEGAHAIGGDEAHDEIAVLELLSSLVDKSLVQNDPVDVDRYRLLESTRQYAREKLVVDGELDRTADRQFAYMMQQLKTAGEEYETTTSDAAVVRLAVELEDARAALDWALHRHRPSDAADLFLATRLWAFLGLHREAVDRAKQLLELADSNDFTRLARLWETIAVSAVRLSHHTSARDAAEQALNNARRSNEPETLADCLLTFVDVMAHARRFDEAQSALEEAGAVGSPSPRRKLRAINARGVTASIRGDLELAADAFAQARKLCASVGNDAGVVSATIGLAEAEHARGETENAIKVARSERTRAERLPNRGDWAFLMLNLAGYLCAVNDLSAAREAAYKALSFYAVSDPDGPITAIALEHLALCFAGDGDLQTAAALEGYARKTFAKLGFEREHTERASHDRLMELLERNLSEAELGSLLDRGERMEAREALARSAPAKTSSD